MADVYINPYTKKPVTIEGRVFFMCGTTGTGKTTFTKNQISKLPLEKIAFDIDGEFKGIANCFPIDKKKITKSVESFKQNVSPMWQKAIIFSEAGLFFTHNSGIDFEMREILKSARRRGNFVFFDFHSLSEVPIEMLKYCNFLVIKKTIMETKQQLSKFSAYPEILNRYKKVMASKNNFETEIIIPRNLEVNF